jgi:thiol-disulfide isomerase/thioredoxin
MNLLNQLTWNDITSPTLSPKEYLKKYKKKIKETYNSYEPKSRLIYQIKEIIKKNNEKLKIVVLGADWCPDCVKNIPLMIKIIKLMNDKIVDMKILYGIMVNALHKPGEPIWHNKRSPPEATNPKFNLTAIPTFYFFNKRGNLVGIIIERPKAGSTLEEEILEILKKSM